MFSFRIRPLVCKRQNQSGTKTFRIHHESGTISSSVNLVSVNHSLNFVDPDTGAHTPRIENTWCGVKRSMLRTGTSKDLFESYLQEWLWRQHYGDEPFENIIKHIADLYEVRKDA